MVTNISSKSELSSLATKLTSQSTQLKSVSDGLKSLLSGIPNYEDINVSGAGSILASNIVNIASDMDGISRAIQGYIADLEAFDVYDLNVEAELAGNKGGNATVNNNMYFSSPSVSTAPSYGASASPIVNNGNVSDSDSSIVERPVTNSNPNNMNNSVVENNFNDNVDSIVEEKPIVNNKPSDLNNSTINTENNNVGTSNVEKPSNNISNNIGNISGVTSDNSVDTSMDQISNNDSIIVDNTVSGDVSDNVFSDDVYVNDDSGYIGQTNNTVSNNVSNNSDDGGSIVPGILGGLGAAAVVGLGAVGGAKVIKNMKENQEINDDEDEDEE